MIRVLSDALSDLKSKVKPPHLMGIAVVVVVLFAVIVLTMCNGDQSVQAPEVEMPEEIDKEPEEVQEPIEVEPQEPKYRAPLTYEGTEEEITTRPFAVFVENSPAARPQSGLDKADIVYEVLAEGGVTRFIAIYQSQKPETIGPIRSAREYMLDIADDYDAVFAHAGGSPAALNRIAREKLPSLSEIVNGSYFVRESFRAKPHNVYSNLDLLRKGAQSRGYRDTYTLPELTFVTEQTAELTPAPKFAEIVIPYTSSYQVKYIYDDRTQKYDRFINNMAHNDLTTNRQLQATNVLIAYAKHSVVDGEGRLAINVHSSGKGYALQQGTAREVTWRYERGMIRFFEGDKEVPYYAGNTWIQVVPDVISASLQN